MILYRTVQKSIPSFLIRLNHVAACSTTSPEVTTLKLSLNDMQKVQSLKIETDVLPIGTIEKDASELQDKTLALPPSLRQVRKLMDTYQDNVVLTQMGSFYELYFEHATKYAPKLNISLTSKTYNHGKVPFAGFPIQQLNRHLKVLVNHFGYSVTIADQFKNEQVPDNDPSKFLRRVTRIVTPGTFIDEAFENFKENSYLLTIDFPENCINKLADSNLKVGLCWCDLSTGELFVQQVYLKDLVSAITRIQPKEILLDASLIPHSIESGNWYPELVELKKYFIKFQTMPSQYRTMDSFYKLFASGREDPAKAQLKYKLQSFTQKEVAALRNTLTYVDDHLPNFSINFQLPERQLTTSIMQIDSRTNAALELHSTVMNNSKKGSLLSNIRRTVTPVGTRLLNQWLSAPSLNLAEIKNRQKMVLFFKKNTEVTRLLVLQLKKIHDLSRILQKFSFGRGDALELVQISQSLKAALAISDLLESTLKECQKSVKPLFLNLKEKLSFDRALVDDVLASLNEDLVLMNEMETLELITDMNIGNGLLDEAASTYSSTKVAAGYIVNPSYHASLQKCHQEYENLLLQKEKLERHFQDLFIDKFGAKKVSLKQRQNNEYAIHVVGSSISLTKINDFIKEGKYIKDQSLRIIQQSSQTRWLSSKEWTELSYQLELAQLHIKKEEVDIINSFKDKFVQKSSEIRDINATLGYLDTISSFAILATEKDLVCPKVDNSTILKIDGGRHLMVEESLSMKSLEKFVDNDCELKGGNLWVITGPNMGGKSTFLRQNAIIVILAQIGCFVPCSSAHIGLVDKIFSRIGSADDLYNEMSTFMVEMIETSFILHGATNRSLAILDEIGRGTSGKEGVSIAFATLKYLIEHNQCKSLFATHFGEELNNIIKAKNEKQLHDKVAFYQSGIFEIDDTKFSYNYKLRPGISAKSDATKVAQLAGFPEEVLKEAESILAA
ncbi:hypothetical protein KAFR_0F00690 [Kazachstania africana CBS 2517]|uniref:DNA mismatch repair proteins mutS family domain-containing protein n=1 Tax=Kazachstania africana (strain ATCC 22294 / BCRC 22015 / CBS 2517 / CECT 1963 / NBRC 1671 / NRRL Y-8276) TaxID=1071382 RepID=H2AWB6_KAZAF|nr:hypothetical protein KAFR_0F00690 [Kazachstania africana CBS 2517]CCF58666.1 hypothetical protein KAFR_0F00690 [Kazachstania africana CBS 2517]